jgi:hypothetical protein
MLSLRRSFSSVRKMQNRVEGRDQPMAATRDSLLPSHGWPTDPIVRPTGISGVDCLSRPIHHQPPWPAPACLQALIPVRNEAGTIAAVIQELHGQGLVRIRVVDNGSGDGTAAVASAAGAEVLSEERPGYGRACWRGLGGLPPGVRWILFCDGDGSDDLAALPRLLAAATDADLVLGNRLAGAEGRRAMTPLQRFGNRLVTRLIQLGWGHPLPRSRPDAPDPPRLP